MKLRIEVFLEVFGTWDIRNLGQINGTSGPPHFNDAQVARFSTPSRLPSLLWVGGRGLIVIFCPRSRSLYVCVRALCVTLENAMLTVLQ